MAEDRGPQVAAVAILFLVLTWVTVSLRVYVRAKILKVFGLDDWLAVLALILFSLYCAFCLKGVEYGTGQHLENIPPAHVPIAIKFWWLCELFYFSNTAALKASIGVFLLRICIKPSQTITIYVVIAVVEVYSLFYFLITLFGCQPIDFFWTRYIGGVNGKCTSDIIVLDCAYAHSAISAWADWTLGILPIFLVWDLKMTPRMKVSVVLILALGALGSTATVVRIPYLKQLGEGDFLFASTDVAIWSTVEPGIGITASAMATLKPLFRQFFSRSKLMGSHSKNVSGSSPWPSSRKPWKAGYFQSGSAVAVGREELGLRDDIAKGVGITTVINSSHSPRSLGDRPSRKDQRNGSLDIPEQHMRKMDSGGDSSGESLPLQNVLGDWTGVRKTTEVRTNV